MKKIIIALLIYTPILTWAQNNVVQNSFKIKVDSFFFDKDFLIKQSSVQSLVSTLNDSIQLKKKYTSDKRVESKAFYELIIDCYGINEKYLIPLKALVYCRYKHPINDATGIDFYELHFEKDIEAKVFFDELKKKKRKQECNYPWISTIYIALICNRVFYIKDAIDSEEEQLDSIVGLIKKSIKPCCYYYK